MSAQLRAELQASLRDVPDHLLELSMNEAAALAWDSGYPHLVLPTLAEEKASELARWNARQQFLKAGAEFDFAA